MLYLKEHEQQIDLSMASNVFNYILLKGQKLSSNHYSYLGLEAIHNFETCTLILFDTNIKLIFTLQGEYQTKQSNPAHYQTFIEKIETIYQTHR